jgi:uncharacterized protein
VRYKLPVGYGKTRLVLLPVDPYLIHAYWEVAPEKLNEAMLRFYRSKPLDYFDVPVDLQSRNWYIHLWRPEESLYADLLLKKDDGTLISLVRSRVIHMPPAQPKMSIEQHFMRVEATERRAEIVPPPPQLAAKPIDAAEIVRETLKNVYASRVWRSKQFEPSGTPPARSAIDLTATAERSFRAGTSSGASDTKK